MDMLYLCTYGEELLMQKFLNITFFILILLLFASTNTYASDRYKWIYSDDNTGYFFDVKTIKYATDYNGNPDVTKIDVWIKTIYTESGKQQVINQRSNYGLTTNGFDQLSYALTHYVFQNNKRMFLEYYYYDFDGNILESYYNQQAKSLTEMNNFLNHSISSQYYGQWDNIVPGSIGETIKDAVWNFAHDNLNSMLMKIRANQN